MNIESFQILTLLWMVQLLSRSISSAQECQPGSKPRHYTDDYVLLSSAYKKTTAEHFEYCYIDCLEEEKCNSVNYHLANGTCEFFNVTKACFPSRFVPFENSIYAETRKQDGCRDLLFLDCMKNKALIGHVVTNFNLQVPALKQCQQKCFLEGKCVSYNLGPVRGQNRSCELNAADHSTRRDFLISKEGYEYCLIWNPCSSNPCAADRLCTPDLSWETFNCNDGGWTQWSSWTGCFLPSTCTPTRVRNCTSPAPQNNGADCTGPAVETRKCSVKPIDITGCENPLGMQDRRISDHQITASSYFLASRDTQHAPWHARLNNRRISGTIGAWGANANTEEYIQIDLGSVKVITKVATQGKPSSSDKQWVTNYSLSYSNDTKKWSNFEGDCIKERMWWDGSVITSDGSLSRSRCGYGLEWTSTTQEWTWIFSCLGSCRNIYSLLTGNTKLALGVNRNKGGFIGDRLFGGSIE